MHLANLQKDVTAVEQDRYLLVRVNTSITVSNADQIRNEIVLAWDECPDSRAMILDLDGVPHLDSSGVGVLMELASRAEKAEVPLRVCCLQKGPHALLVRTRLNRMFEIFPTLEEASHHVPRRRAGRLPAPRKLTQIDGNSHSHRLLWTVTLLLLVVLLAGGAYGVMALGAYHGQMNLLPSMQANLVAAGQRIDAAENSVRSWAADRDQWRKRVEAKIDRALPGARRQANDRQAAIDQRTSNLQTQVNNLQAAQTATETRVSNVEQQVRQLQNARAEQPSTAQPAEDGADGQARTDFTLPVHSEQEVAPGVWVGITSTDVAHQRYDAQLRLAPDRHGVGVHDHATGQPLEFSLQGDNQRGELVVTHVTKDSVLGYVLLPRQPAAAMGAN
ncbi:MAG TPA: STAS domain-containing protein [Bryobacteraceae bacterium]|nr:STAS domain-containing protein [Bryobacteraceae bacterium]